MRQMILSLFFVCLCSVGCKFGTASKTSAVTVNFPDKLPADVQGYSVCLERVDHSDTKCSKGFLVQKNVAEVSFDSKLKNDCSAGYRLKMWLWKGDKVPSYALDTKGSSDFSTENGFIILPKDKLNGGDLPLKMNFIPVSGKSGSEGSSGSVDLNIEITIEGESSITPDKKEKESDIKVDTSCNTNDTTADQGGSEKKPGTDSTGGGNSTDVGPSPTGQMISMGTAKPTIKPSGYPTMVVYTFSSGCAPCESLKSWIKSNGATFKGKMHIYQNDVPMSTNPVQFCNSQGSRPTVEFYNKDGSRTSDCIIGYDPNQITQIVNKMSK